jgi:DNA-binding NtrC family response regulator
MPTAAHPPAPTALDDWPRASVLLVDDEQGMRNFLEKTLAPRVGDVKSAASAEEADALVRRHRFDLVILDISLPGKSGLEWLRELREQGYSGEVVLITAYADLDTAIEALRAGASDFILKPFRLTQILNALKHGLERGVLKRENWVLKRTLSQRTPAAGGLVGNSIAMRGLQAAIRRVAAVQSTVLLTGESGTGKEVVARFIHHASRRSQGPFIAINCAALPDQLLESELFGHERGAFTGAVTTKPGRIEQASGGVLFLDEVGEMAPTVQAKLLRVLEEREFMRLGSTRVLHADIRVIAATNRDLHAAMQRGEFREDLYYRLGVFEISLPALRDRLEDVLELADSFLAEIGETVGRPAAGISREARDHLLTYEWPGNVRELRNAIERAVILADGGFIRSEHLPVTPRRAARSDEEGSGTLPAGGVNLEDIERSLVVKALTQARHNKTRAAKLLGLTRAQLYSRIEKYGLTGTES